MPNVPLRDLVRQSLRARNAREADAYEPDRSALERKIARVLAREWLGRSFDDHLAGAQRIVADYALEMTEPLPIEEVLRLVRDRADR